MAEPILGRAYPALLAPGLRVCLDSAYGGGMGTLLADPLAPEDGYWVVWDADLTPGEPVSAVRPRWPATLDDYRIDYADPHTRDRVCRALADAEFPFDYARNGSAPWWYGVICSTSERIDAWHLTVLRDVMEGDGPALALRAVADAVWGEAAPGVSARTATATLFTCRACGAAVDGWTDGSVARPGWRNIDNIDGPNAVCPDCASRWDPRDWTDEWPEARLGEARPVRAPEVP